jgi:hypothetical protein
VTTRPRPTFAGYRIEALETRRGLGIESYAAKAAAALALSGALA